MPRIDYLTLFLFVATFVVGSLPVAWQLPASVVTVVTWALACWWWSRRGPPRSD